MPSQVQFFSDSIGNLPELPGIYPHYHAPIVCLNSAGERENMLARWGLPSLKDQPTEKPNKGTTRVRHSWRDDWKESLGFAVDKGEPVTFFGGYGLSGQALSNPLNVRYPKATGTHNYLHHLPRTRSETSGFDN